MLSHLSAAWLHSLRRDSRITVDVSAHAARLGRRNGHVVVHSAARLRPEDVNVIDGLPVTSVARTILDCTPRLGRRGAEKLCREAELRRALDLRALGSLLAHVPGHTGAAALAAALQDLGGASGLTASYHGMPS